MRDAVELVDDPRHGRRVVPFAGREFAVECRRVTRPRDAEPHRRLRAERANTEKRRDREARQNLKWFHLMLSSG